MQTNKKNERGSVMVEAIAVVALLGLMGTLLYRQVKNRNEELDNINMASEIRMVKDATAAYLQADQAALSADCTHIDGHKMTDTEKQDIDTFLPYNWQSDDNDGIISYFDIYLTCSGMDEDLAPGRNAIYATIIPQESTLPPNFNLKRAARVANLIGSDGGVHMGSDDTLYGTMGAWEVDCPSGSACYEGNYFVATTGMDIYVPESNTPDNTVLVPDKIAFKELHSSAYFSVGNNNLNCVRNYDATNNRFAHEVATSAGDYARADSIARVGGNCDPLFWVGQKESSNSSDRSEEGHVYIKQNLYIGRDNANNNQAVAIETDSANNAMRQINVYDATGKERLTLNARGQIIGRKEGTSGLAESGYRLDSETGEIVLFKEYEVDGHTVQIPTLRLKDTKMESSVQAEYEDEDGEHTAPYAVDPADTSIMNDIRLISRGGAKLSEILPDYIAKGIESYTANASGHETTVAKPTCPKGYVRAITVTPIQSNQDVKELKLDEVELTVPGTKVTIPGSTAGTKETGGKLTGDNITLTQHEPVKITITQNETSYSDWKVDLQYNTTPPTNDDPITALIHTYCVYDDENFNGDDIVSSAVGNDAFKKELGTAVKNGTRACSPTSSCDSTDICLDNKCVKRPTCSESDRTKIGPNLYCIDGKQVYLECFSSADCHGKTCNENNQCVDTTATET